MKNNTIYLDYKGLLETLKILLGVPKEYTHRTINHCVKINTGMYEHINKEKLQQEIYDWLKIRVEKP